MKENTEDQRQQLLAEKELLGDRLGAIHEALYCLQKAEEAFRVAMNTPENQAV